MLNRGRYQQSFISILMLAVSVWSAGLPVNADVFDSDQILIFHLTISADNWEQMQPRQRQSDPFFTQEPVYQKPNDRPSDRRLRSEPRRRRPPVVFDLVYVKTEVEFQGQVWSKVGVRFKGNSSLKSNPNSLKKPFKFDFDYFVEGQRFFGYDKLNFSNGFKDPSLLREKLAYDLFHKLDIPASRAVFAQLFLTVPNRYQREYLGLYTMVEQVDQVFLRDRFGNDDGLLVKPDRIPDLIPLGTSWADHRYNYELKSNPRQADTDRLVSFLRFVGQADDETFSGQIEQYFNVDSFLQLMAINSVLVNLDSYFGTGHNFYLYHNTHTDKYEMIPWDLNEAFGHFQFQAQPTDLINWDIDHPAVGKKLLVERLLNIEDYRHLYHRNLRDLADIEFHPDRIFNQIDRYYQLISPAVETDLHKQFSTGQFHQSINRHFHPDSKRPTSSEQRPPMIHQILGLKPFIKQRGQSISQQLDGEERGAILQPPPRRPRLPKDFPSR
mgnify:CR=1 FL=1